jgi:hypothetical protein
MRLKKAGYMRASLSTLNSIINVLVEISNGKLLRMHYSDGKHALLVKVRSYVQCVLSCDHVNSTLITPSVVSFLLLPTI